MVEILVAVLLFPIIATIWVMSVCLTISMYRSFKNGEM